MKKLLPIAAIALVMTSTAWAGCTIPAAPVAIPDGKSATKDTMMAAKKDVDRYKKEMDAYLACEVNDTRAQLAHSELQRVAARFNNEVRAFKTANTGS
jgi:hypothetical protein